MDSHLFYFLLRSKNQKILHHPLEDILTACLTQNIWRNPKMTQFCLLSETQFLIWCQLWNRAKQKGSGWGSCGQLRWDWLMKHSPKYSHNASAQYEYFNRCYYESVLKCIYLYWKKSWRGTLSVMSLYFFSPKSLENILLVPVSPRKQSREGLDNWAKRITWDGLQIHADTLRKTRHTEEIKNAGVFFCKTNANHGSRKAFYFIIICSEMKGKVHVRKLLNMSCVGNTDQKDMSVSPYYFS